MKKYRWLAVAVLLPVLTGCQKTETGQSTLTVSSDGSVTAVTVDSFSEDYYSFEELLELVSEETDSYNSAYGDVLTVNDCSVNEKTDTVTLSIRYASCVDYSQFNGKDLYAGSLTEAAEVYDFDEDLVDPDGNVYDPGVVMEENPDADVLILEEETAVEVPGTILYVSENVEIESDKEAAVQGEGSLDGGISGYAFIVYE